MSQDDVGVYKCVCKNNMNIHGDKVEGKIMVDLAPGNNILGSIFYIFVPLTNIGEAM